eukprot:TRINITY_DN2054_c0_g2_i4.p1 TRINITY_DN2054_c0_g2~~TRINITY_DN2054_c0_g2_i4.p1  ORF type:complete len:193 (-),score=26.23 TRINITY_DN2054_c0_g2_i4:327-905(-)
MKMHVCNLHTISSVKAYVTEDRHAELSKVATIFERQLMRSIRNPVGHTMLARDGQHLYATKLIPAALHHTFDLHRNIERGSKGQRRDGSKRVVAVRRIPSEDPGCFEFHVLLQLKDSATPKWMSVTEVAKEQKHLVRQCEQLIDELPPLEDEQAQALWKVFQRTTETSTKTKPRSKLMLNPGMLLPPPWTRP